MKEEWRYGVIVNPDSIIYLPNDAKLRVIDSTDKPCNEHKYDMDYLCRLPYGHEGAHIPVATELIYKCPNLYLEPIF